MDSLSDQQLLRDYAERRSESAFAELVRRHVDLIYSAALRMVCDAHLAEDVTQGAFVALAQNAWQLSDRPVLAGWLHRTARNLAANTVRSDVRRRAREQEAAAMNELLSAEADADWEKIAPHLDAALDDLSEPDRDALLLRYFERKSAHEIAQAFGISDEAAQKRVSRAVERLREFFSKRGVAIGAGGMIVLISANAVQSAPLALAATISTAAILTGTTTTTAIATKAIAMTLVQKTLVTATVAVILGAGVYEAHRSTQLRQQVQTLQQQQAPLADQIRLLQKERDALTNELVDLRAENSKLKSDPNQAELLKLRGEVTQLKSTGTKNENDPMESAAKDLLAKVEQFKQQVDQWPEKKIPELQFLTPTDWLNAAQIPQFTNDISARSAISELRMAAKNRFAPMLAKALRDYTQANGGQLPNDLSQLKPFIDPPVGDDILGRYNLLHTGKLSDVPSGDMLVSEKAVVDERFDSLYSIAPNRFSYKVLIGDGIRGPSSGEVTVYIQGLPGPHVSIKAPR